MPNDTLLNAIAKYLNNKDDVSFETNIVRILIHIYNEIDFINPYLLHEYSLIDENILRYGLPKEELIKFKQVFTNYMQTHDTDAFLTVYKIIMDMILYKYKNSFITKEEVAEYEKIFFQGKSVNVLNKYWDKTLYKINNKLSFKEVKENVFNPYAYYLQGKTMADIQEMSNESLYHLNLKILRDYNIKVDDSNLVNKLNKAIDKAMMPKGQLSTGNGFVDILMFLSFVATEIMMGAIIAVQMLRR